MNCINVGLIHPPGAGGKTFLDAISYQQDKEDENIKFHGLRLSYPCYSIKLHPILRSLDYYQLDCIILILSVQDIRFDVINSVIRNMESANINHQRLLVLVNKMDLLNKNEIKNAITFLRDYFQGINIQYIIIPISLTWSKLISQMYNHY